MPQSHIEKYAPLWGFWNIDYLIDEDCLASVYKVHRDDVVKKTTRSSGVLHVLAPPKKYDEYARFWDMQ